MVNINEYLGNMNTPQQNRYGHEKQFDQLEASELYCPNCRQAVPLRKNLLLVLPEGDKYDYRCVYCGASIGSKIVSHDAPNGIII